MPITIRPGISTAASLSLFSGLSSAGGISESSSDRLALIASNRNRVPYTTGSTTNLMKYYGMSAVAPASTGLTSVRVKFMNYFAVPNAGTSITNVISFILYAGLEYPIGGTVYPLRFNGNDFKTLAPGDEVWTDWSVGVTIPAGAWYRINFDQEHLGTSGAYNQLQNLLLGPTTTPGRIDRAMSGTDNTVHRARTAGLSAFATTTLAYGPSLVQGVPAITGTKSAFLVGDSIMRGVGDTLSTTQQGDYLSGTSPTAPYYNFGCLGWAETSISSAYPYYSMAVPSRVVQGNVFTTANLNTQFAPIDNSKPSHIFLALGVNDLQVGRTAAQVLTDIISAVALLKARYPSAKVYVATITPVTNTIDAYATTIGQTFTGTPPAGGTVTWSNFDGLDDTTGRRLLNANIRAGMVTGADGFIDVAASVQDAIDPRKWRVDLGQPTSDGVHPRAILHRLIASDVNLASIMAL